MVLAESDPDDWMGLEWTMVSMSCAETDSVAIKRMMEVRMVEISFIIRIKMYRHPGRDT